MPDPGQRPFTLWKCIVSRFSNSKGGHGGDCGANSAEIVDFEERNERLHCTDPLLSLKVTNGHFSREKWRWNGFNWAGVGGRRRLLLLEFYPSLGFEPSSITSNSEIQPLHHAEPCIYKWNFRGATFYKMVVFKKENSLGQGGGKVCDFILA